MLPLSHGAAHRPEPPSSIAFIRGLRPSPKRKSVSTSLHFATSNAKSTAICTPFSTHLQFLPIPKTNPAHTFGVSKTISLSGTYEARAGGMNYPNSQKSALGPSINHLQTASQGRQDSEEKNFCESSAAAYGGNASKSSFGHSGPRLRQRRVCLPGFWVAQP